MLLEFNGKRYTVFASSSADGSTATGAEAEAEAAQRQQGPPPLFAERAEELFCAPLRTFMQALRSHFGLHTDIVLSFPSLQLVFPLNLTFAEQLSLAHVERLHEAQAMATATESGDAGPLVMRLEDTGVSFIAQYNRLTRMLREGATQEDAIVLDEAEAEAVGEGEGAGDDGDDDDVVVVEAAALQTEENPAEAAVATAGEDKDEDEEEEEEEATAEEAVVVVSDSEDAEAREKQKPLDTATESEKPIDGEQKEDEGSLLGEVDLEEVEAELGPTKATKVAQEELSSFGGTRPDDNDDAGPAPIGDAGASNAGSISKESPSANPIAEDTAAEQPGESDALVSGADAQPSVDHKRGREDDAAEELGNDSFESKKARVAEEETETGAEALPAEDDVRAYNVDAAGDVVVEDELGAAEVTVEIPDPAPAAESTTATQQGPGSGNGSGNGTSTAALEETATKDEGGEDDHFTDDIDGAGPALTPDAFLTGEEGVEEEDDDDDDALLLDDDAIATATATATAAPSANVE